MLEQALQYLSYGLQSIPLKVDKRPFAEWKEQQNRLQTESELRATFDKWSKNGPIPMLGVVAGKVSGNVEVIDVDCKYDLTESLFEDLKQMIDDNLPEIADSFVICQTKNNGYHLYYKCAEIVGNKKLARRPASDKELLANPNAKVSVLIETRGEGGYFVAPPSAGYKLIQGTFDQIPTITPEQRKHLFTVAMSFNSYFEAEYSRPAYTPGQRSTWEGLSPFADYNQRGDIIELLERHGWSFVFQQGPKIHLKRPGDSDAKTSGNFHEQFRKLYVWSSSTVLPSEKAISPTDVFTLLECNGDIKEARRKLLTEGYGTAGPIRQRVSQVDTNTIKVKASISNDEGIDLSAESILTEERIKATPMQAARVYYSKQSNRYEILDALDLLERNSPVQVFVVEVEDLADLSTLVNEVYPSEFKALDIMSRYDEVYEASNGNVNASVKDSFLTEFITVRQTLTDPLEIGRFRSLWLEFNQANNLGIGEEEIKAVEEKLRVNKERDEQNQAFTDLVEKAADLQCKGELGKALKALTEGANKINADKHSDLFYQLTQPLTEAELALQLSLKPNDLETGYTIDKEELLLPIGAITFVAGATGHGKTALLTNLAIRTAQRLPDKTTYLIHYEQDLLSAYVLALNTFINKELSINNRRSIRSYFRNDRSTYYMKPAAKEDFETGKSDFYKELINTGKLVIKYLDFYSDTLCDSIRWLYTHGNAGAVFIDYVQLINKEGKFSDRQKEIKDICIDLKDLAIETELPLILAAQFNRQVLSPARMIKQNIGEAGDLERVAALIVGIWNNNETIYADKDDLERLKGYQEIPNTMYTKILKDRSGPPGRAELMDYNGNTGFISNRSNAFVNNHQTTEPGYNPFA